MFNGIIHNKGTLKSKNRTKNSSIIEIYSSLKFSNKEIGSSISCNGACLTLTKILGKNIFFYLSNETLARTNFKKIKIGKSVNIEKSLFFGKSISEIALILSSKELTFSTILAILSNSF